MRLWLSWKWNICCCHLYCKDCSVGAWSKWRNIDLFLWESVGIIRRLSYPARCSFLCLPWWRIRRCRIVVSLWQYFPAARGSLPNFRRGHISGCNLLWMRSISDCCYLAGRHVFLLRNRFGWIGNFEGKNLSGLFRVQWQANSFLVCRECKSVPTGWIWI